MKYTTRADDCNDLESVFVKSRSEGFGKEVKNRIMLGNFVLSSGYYDAYYGKAKKHLSGQTITASTDPKHWV